MHTLELREPTIIINSAIEIIEELEVGKMEELLKISQMNEEEKRIIGYENIIDICLKLKQYRKLMEDLEKVRELATEQLMNSMSNNKNRG